MFGAVIVAWLHYLSILFFAGLLVSQIYMLKFGPSLETVRTLARIDRFYGISAGAVVLTGLARIPLAHGGKGLDYYLHNGAFHGSVTAFIVGVLISLAPTMRYLRWKKGTVNDSLPTAEQWNSTRKFVHMQLTIMALIALLMPIMAKGLGH